MPVIEEYELHGGKHDRPAKFISIICKCVQTKTERHFAKKDQELLIKTFEDLLGIDPIKDTCIIEDPEGDEIIDYVQNAKRDLDSRYRMVIVHISSYGDLGHIYSNDREKIAINDIIDEFRGSKCAQMVGKPKWFIVQACTEGLYEQASDTEADASLIDKKVTYVPAEADILTTISEIPGSVPWRSRTYSPFIEALCTSLKNNISKDLTRIYSRTMQAVHEELERQAPTEFEKSGVLPYMTSTLTKALYFSTVNAALPDKK